MPNRFCLGLTLPPLFVSLVLGFSMPADLQGASESAIWDQWRGPSRDGTVHGSKPWPVDLSGLETSWRVELGRGYPGPIVSRDRIFVAETLDDSTEGARALDRKTGRELWKTTWTGKGKVPFFAARNGDWIRATPTFDGETLFVGGMEEVLVALDGNTGQELWRVDFPARFGTKIPDFGFVSAPLIDGGALYIQAANSLVKLDKKSGETLWRALSGPGDIMANGAFSSPVIATLGGRRQLVVQTRTTLHGLTMDSGEVLWSQDVPSFRGMNILTPLIYEDSIFTSTYRNNSFLFRIETDGKEGLTVRESWTHKAQAYMSSPVIVDGHAYVHLGNGRLTCIDLETGESTWTTKAFGEYWSMAARGDRILALDEGGELHLLAADPKTFRLLDSRSISKSPTWGYLAVAGEEVFVRELEAVAAFRWNGKSASSTADRAAAGR